jgi:hypothetical protein
MGMASQEIKPRLLWQAQVAESQRFNWGCTICPSSDKTEADKMPDGWRVIHGQIICAAHDHHDAALVDALQRWPRYVKLSSAGGMYWLTEVNGVPVASVKAYTSPYAALITWAQEHRS